MSANGSATGAGDEVHVDIEDAGGRELRDVEQRPPDEEIAEMDEERERRLDPDNRPEHAEVDNTGRDFDTATGHFTDSEGHAEAEQQYAEPDDES